MSGLELSELSIETSLSYNSDIDKLEDQCALKTPLVWHSLILISSIKSKSDPADHTASIHIYIASTIQRGATDLHPAVSIILLIHVVVRVNSFGES